MGALALALGGLILLAAEGLRQSPVPPARDTGGSLLSPVYRAGTAVHHRAALLWYALFRVEQLEQERAALELHAAELRLAMLTGLAQERFAAGHDRIAPALPESTKLVSTSVLGHPPTAGRRVLWIGAGEDRGIQRGMIVVGAHGVIGTVHRVFATTALVTMLGDGASRWSALGIDCGESGVLAGTGDPSVVEFQFTQGTPTIAPGELVVTSGLAGSAAPGGIPIGTVLDVSRNREGNLVARVELAEDPVDSRLVFVLQSTQLPWEPPAR